MSRFSELARLKELDEATKNAPDWPCPVEDAVFCEAICDASPWLLKIAEAFQPGDAEKLKLVIRHLFPMSGNLPGTDAPLYTIVTMLHRMQAAAEELEHDA